MTEHEEIDSVSLEPMQYSALFTALSEYDAPDTYWDDETKSSDFRQECAREVSSRLDRKVREGGLQPLAIALDQKEYRVCVEALNQLERNGSTVVDVQEIISNLQYFKEGGERTWRRMDE